MTDETRRERALRLFEEVNGFPAPDPAGDPLTEGAVDLVFGEIWNRPGLTRKERRWIAITCAAASGAPVAMEAHVGAALRTGDISIDEMREFVLHFAMYQGFPKATALRMAVESVWAGMQP